MRDRIIERGRGRPRRLRPHSARGIELVLREDAEVGAVEPAASAITCCASVDLAGSAPGTSPGRARAGCACCCRRRRPVEELADAVALAGDEDRVGDQRRPFARRRRAAVGAHAHTGVHRQGMLARC